MYPVGKLRVYCLKALKKLSIYPLGNTPSAPSVKRTRRAAFGGQVVDESEDEDEEVQAGGSEDGDEDEIEGGDDGGDHPEASSEEDELEEDL